MTGLEVLPAVAGSPLVSGAWYHYDASQLSLSNGSQISSWSDLSGNGFNLGLDGYGNPGPTFESGVQNGLGIAQYTEINNTYSDLVTSQSNATPNSPWTWFATVAVTGGATNVLISGGGAVNPSAWEVDLVASGSGYQVRMNKQGYGGTVTIGDSTSVIAPDTFVVLAGRYDGTSWSIWVNSTTADATGSPGNLGLASSKLQVGSNTWGAGNPPYGNGSEMDLGELAAYNTALTDTQVQQNISSLQSKWGIGAGGSQLSQLVSWYHYDASQLSLSNGSEITSWPDLSSHGLTLGLDGYGEPGPTYETNVFGTKPAAYYQVGSNFYDDLTSTTPMATPSSPWTWFATVALTGGASTNVLISGGGSVNPSAWEVRLVASGSGYQVQMNKQGYGGTVTIGDSASTISSGVPVVLAGRYDGNNWTIWVNSTTPDASGTAGNVGLATSKVQVGSDTFGAGSPPYGSGSAMYLGELLNYNAPLTNAQVQQTIMTLEGKWTATPLTPAATNGSGADLKNDPTCNNGAYPVNCASGNFWHSFTDVSIGGRGPGLDLARTYNSLSASTEGMFGYGWSSTYDMHLVVNGDGSVTITSEDGSQVVAKPQGSGYSVPSWADSTLTHNGDGSWSYVRGRTHTFAFNSSGQLTAIRDLNNYATTLSYNTSGQLQTVTDAAGRQLAFSFGANGLVSKVTDPAGQSISYCYDATCANSSSQQLLSVTDRAGRTTSFTYAPSTNLIATMKLPAGGVVSNTFDSLGRVTQQQDPVGNVTTYNYSGNNFSSSGGTTTITSEIPGPNNSLVTTGVETQQYANGELTTMTKGVNTSSPSTWSYSYDPMSLGQISVADPDNHTTTSSYDQDGNLLTRSDALNQTTTYTYNSLDEPLSVTDPMGIATSYTYDTAGNMLTKAVSGTGGSPVETTVYTYGDSSHPGDVTQVTDPDNHITGFSYDSYGDVVTITTHPTTSSTDTTAFVYDVLGRKVCEASGNATAAGVSCPAAGQPPVADTTIWVYDADNGVTSVTDPLNHTTGYLYDADGNQTQVTDPLGNLTRTTYDANDRKTAVTSGYGTSAASTTSYAYDLAPTSTPSATNPCGSSTASSVGATSCSDTTNPLGTYSVSYFDAQDRRVAETQDGGTAQQYTTTFSYDAAGNPLTQVSPAGTTTNGYDADNRLVSITYSSPGTGYATAHGVTYTYNADAQRTQMTDGTGTTSYSYDSLGRLSSTTNGAGAAMGYGYDGDSNITSLMYPNGQSVTRGYDGAGEWISVADWQNHSTSFSYDHDGNLANQGLGNGMQVASSYDNTDNVLSANLTRGSSTIDQATYSRNADNQVANDSQCGSSTYCYSETYNYDPLGRVASLEEPQNTPPAYPYSYDTAGNLTGFPTGIAQSYNSSSELTSVAPGIGQLGPVETSFVGDGASSAGVNLPTGVMPFDQILVGVVELNSITTNTPAGYTSVGTYSASATGSAQIQLFRRTATGGESSVALSFNLPVTGGVAIMASVYRGVDATDPIEQLSSASGVLPANNTISVPSITTQLANEDLLMYQGTVPSSSTGGSFSTPGMSEVAQVDTGSGNIGSATAGLAGTVQASAGATGAKNVTYSGGAASLVGVLLSLRPSVSTLSYDPSGDRTAETTPGRPSQTMGYDQVGRLVSFASSGGTYGYAYNGDGLRMQKTPPSGPLESYSWDVTSATPEIVTDGSMSYVYGPGGMVLEQIQAPAITYVNGTTYLDALGTTTSQTINLPSGTAAGDQVIVGVTEAQGETSSISGYTSRGSFSQPNADSLDVYNHTVAAGDSSFTVTWQTNGSTHQKEVVVAVYRGVDPNTPVDAVTGVAASSASTSLSVGPLTASQVGEELVMVQSAIGNTTGVTWSANGMAERSPSSASQTLTASAVADQSLSSAGSTGTRTETISGSVTTPNLAGTLIALLPVQAYFYVHDQRGTTRVIADSAGNVLASYVAGPYGQNPASSGSVAVLSSNPFVFEGQYTDAESGYQYLVHRYYDPETGQFISSDPLVNITGQPYSYSNDDPVNESDPLGLWGWNPISDVTQAWNDTGGKAVSAVHQHWHGIVQVATVAASGLGSAACIAATDGLCALALPEIGAATGAAVYGEGGGQHTLGGYLSAAAEGGIGGSVALICAAGVCEVAGSVAVGGALVNGLWGAGQGAWDYANSDGCHTAGGYVSAGANGFAQGGVPWDEIWKFIRGGE